jgi:hypothetical protein
MRKIGLTLLTLMLSGCMTTRMAYVQNGTEVYEANCNGLARTIADCYAQASKKCNGKFKEVNKDQTNTLAPYGNSFVPVTKRSLMFICQDEG